MTRLIRFAALLSSGLLISFSARTVARAESGVAILDVDTDRRLGAIDRNLYGHFLEHINHSVEDGLFAAWRKDPDFVLNQPVYDEATVLVAGPDFGTGSSREHAVWALLDYGFRVVVSSRFGDIFRGNAGKAGLLAARVDQDVVDRLWRLVEDDPATEVVVDLERPAMPEGNSVAQEQVRLLEIGELPATGGRRKQHGKCGVLRKFDLRDRVHHHGKT